MLLEWVDVPSALTGSHGRLTLPLCQRIRLGNWPRLNGDERFLVLSVGWREERDGPRVCDPQQLGTPPSRLVIPMRVSLADVLRLTEPRSDRDLSTALRSPAKSGKVRQSPAKQTRILVDGRGSRINMHRLCVV